MLLTPKDLFVQKVVTQPSPVGDRGVHLGGCRPPLAGFKSFSSHSSLLTDYYGTVVNTAARVEAVCHGGQIGITQDVYDELEGEFPGPRGEV